MTYHLIIATNNLLNTTYYLYLATYIMPFYELTAIRVRMNYSVNPLQRHMYLRGFGIMMFVWNMHSQSGSLYTVPGLHGLTNRTPC